MSPAKTHTLVLDLDETLVHTTYEYSEDADFSIPFDDTDISVTTVVEEVECCDHHEEEDSDCASFFDDASFNIISSTACEENIAYYVTRRPYMQTFLERVAEMFDVMIFTASEKKYADTILNLVDPENKLISRRFYHDSRRLLSDGYGFAKDLTVLGVDMAKVAIVDDLPRNFRLQKDNGIPIKPWLGDSSDQELVSLLPFLESLVVADDVRPLVAKRFGEVKHVVELALDEQIDKEDDVEQVVLSHIQENNSLVSQN